MPRRPSRRRFSSPLAIPIPTHNHLPQLKVSLIVGRDGSRSGGRTGAIARHQTPHQRRRPREEALPQPAPADAARGPHPLRRSVQPQAITTTGGSLLASAAALEPGPDRLPGPRHRREVVALLRARRRGRGVEAAAGGGPGEREVVGAVVEDGGVVGAVGEQGDRDAPGDREEDVVRVVVPVHDQGPRDEAGAQEGQRHGQPLPQGRVVVRKGLELRVQVQRQEGPEEEGFRRVPAGERLHGEDQGVLWGSGVGSAGVRRDVPPEGERVRHVWGR